MEANFQKKPKIEPPPRDVLKKKIRTLPISAIAREYGTRDKVVRMWCGDYGLPTKRGEIRKMTQAEWRKL